MRCAWPVLLSCLTAPAAAAPGAGTLGDPILVDAFPYAARGTTVGGSHAVDHYACGGQDESGPEVVYAFTLGAPARVTAWTSGDGGGVDVDVQLLADATLAGTSASDCVARGNVIAEAQLDAGVHYVVVDSFNGDAHAGAYVLHLEAIGDAWIERTLADGVTWRARRFAAVASGAQVVHELVVDPTATGVAVRAFAASGCQTVGALGAQKGAIAGVNGGYFDTGNGGCAPVSLLKSSGVLVGTNTSSLARGAFGLSAAHAPMVATIAMGADWPAVEEAHGGGPVLVTGGTARMGNAAWAQEGLVLSGFVSRNPRTFAASDALGRVHLGAVDGRRANAVGMSLDEEAAFVAGGEIGGREAVNLDGGGSTTMWIAGATPNGVVDYPSDATQEDPTHPGARAVSGGFFVLAPPYDHPPRFQTTPLLDAQLGVAYRYDADAIDLDVDDVLTFALDAAPAGMGVDAQSGAVDYTPPPDAPGAATVTLVVRDGRGGQAQQSWTLAIAGDRTATGEDGAATGGDGAVTGGDGAVTSGDGGRGSSGRSGDGAATGGGHHGSAPDGGCRTSGRAPDGSALALVGALLLARRRRRAVAPFALAAVAAVALAACDSGTSSRGRDGHASFAYLAQPGCSDGCLLDKFQLAAGGARQSIRVDVDSGYSLADVQSSDSQVVTFVRDGGNVVATTAAEGQADLILVDARGAEIDRIRIGVAAVDHLDTQPGWSGDGPTILAGVALRTTDFTKRDPQNRILLGAGAVRFDLVGPLAATAPAPASAPESAVESVVITGQPGSAKLTAVAGAATLSYPIAVVALSQLARASLHLKGIVLGPGGIPDAYLESTLSTDSTPIYGVGCQWTPSSPALQIASDTVATQLGQPPVDVTIFRLTQPGTFSAVCSVGAIGATAMITRDN